MTQMIPQKSHCFSYCALDPKFFCSAVSVSDASAKVGVSENRLLELCDMLVCPHYRIDNSTPRFHIPTLRKWVEKHLVETVSGQELPYITIVNLVINDARATYAEMPESLRHINGLFIASITSNYSGIYFLCKDAECVYVGQAVCIAKRIPCHNDDKVFDMAYCLPIPESGLIQAEKEFIKALKPKYNKCAFSKLCKKGGA